MYFVFFLSVEPFMKIIQRLKFNNCSKSITFSPQHVQDETYTLGIAYVTISAEENNTLISLITHHQSSKYYCIWEQKN